MNKLGRRGGNQEGVPVSVEEALTRHQTHSAGVMLSFPEARVVLELIDIVM